MAKNGRYPCPDCKKRMIWRSYNKGVRTYQASAGKCRICARKDAREKVHKEYLGRRVAIAKRNMARQEAKHRQ
jgi:predicted RNA-binding Zn-ribbon protein involved in translation (DUF1610 family)